MRLDLFLVEKKIFDTRTKAKQSIEKGEIFIDNKKINKPSYEISIDFDVNLIQRKFEKFFVSLGGYKLEKAFNDFNLNVSNLICLDIGSSTGGFTDCLLQHGAKKVYCVDLNESLLHEKLKKDERVFQIVKNAKNLIKSDFNEDIDFLCADLSFISEKIILPVIYSLLNNGKQAVILIKPQFEMEKRIRFKNGIIKDKKIISSIKDTILNFAVSLGFKVLGITVAPIYKDKNTEFLLYIVK